MWADLIDSVKTNHGNASVNVVDKVLEIELGGVVIVARPKGKKAFEVEITGREKVTVDSEREVYYEVTDELNRIWAKNQKPKSSPGSGASYSGRGGGDDDLVVGGGDLYVPPDDDDDD